MPDIVRRHRRAWITAIAVSIVVAVSWILLPWEWSMIDDPGLVRSVASETAVHGFPLGLLTHVGVMFTFDRDWSLFRPLYWVYPSFVYWLPIGVAHLLRLGMFVVAIGGPLFALRRRRASRQTRVVAALMLVAGSLYLMLGLFYVSLQELSGAALVGLGLAARTSRGRLASWLGAAWFKSTFAWLLLGEAWASWRDGARRTAVASAVLGAGTLGIAAWMAARGSYTGRYLEGSLLASTLRANAALLVSPAVLLPVAAFGLWLVAARHRPTWSRDSLVLLVGTVGYVAQLMPWVTSGYYAGGAVYMLSVFLVTMLPTVPRVGMNRAAPAMLGLLVLATVSAFATLSYGISANSQWRETSACLARTKPSLVIVGAEFPYENAWRIEDNVRLRVPQWEGRVRSESDAPIADAPRGAVLVARDDRQATTGSFTSVVCDAADARILARP